MLNSSAPWNFMSTPFRTPPRSRRCPVPLEARAPACYGRWSKTCPSLRGPRSAEDFVENSWKFHGDVIGVWMGHEIWIPPTKFGFYECESNGFMGYEWDISSTCDLGVSDHGGYHPWYTPEIDFNRFFFQLSQDGSLWFGIVYTLTVCIPVVPHKAVAEVSE